MLTAVGKELQAAISAPVEDIVQAIEGLNRLRDSPAGRVRLNVVGDAEPLLLGPVLPTFMERYPDVEIEISSSNRRVDMTEGGYDAGIRNGDTVPEDMIVQRLSGDIRWVVAGSPSWQPA